MLLCNFLSVGLSPLFTSFHDTNIAHNYFSKKYIYTIYCVTNKVFENHFYLTIKDLCNKKQFNPVFLKK